MDDAEYRAFHNIVTECQCGDVDGECAVTLAYKELIYRYDQDEAHDMFLRQADTYRELIVAYLEDTHWDVPIRWFAIDEVEVEGMVDHDGKVYHFEV